MKSLPLCLFLCIVLCCCKTRYITQEVPIEIHDTTYKLIFQQKTDTLWRCDSINIIDTMWIDTSTIKTLGMPILRHNRITSAYSNQGKVSVQYKTDTLIQAKETPIPINKEETKEVNVLYWWQRVLIWIGTICLVIVFSFLMYKLKKIF